MVEVQQTRDTCVDHLTVTSGVELEIMANLKSVSQVDAVLEGDRSSYDYKLYEIL